MGTGGVDAFGSSDPWGMREEPEDFRGLSNQDIRQQQEQAIRGKTIQFTTVLQE